MVHDVLAVAFALTAVLNAGMAALAWQRRAATPAATALAAVFASLAFWSVVNVPLNFAVPRLLHDVLQYSSFVGILGSVVSLYLLSRLVADPHYRPRRAGVAHLVGVPLLILAVVATDPWHHLFLTRITALAEPPWFENRLGPLFWAHAAWCYALLTVAYAVLIRAWWRGAPPVRRQVGLLMLGGLVSTAANVVVISHPEWLSGRDLTPLSFTITALVDAYAVLRVGLLRVVPIARAAVLDTVTDIVVVVDAGGTVVDVNPTGRVYLHAKRPDLPADPIGVPARVFLSERALGDLPGGQARYTIEYAPGLHLDVSVTAIHGRRGRDLGRVVVGRDISELVQTRRHLEQVQAQLAEQAVRDPLTGLHNRRHLDTVAGQLLQQARSEGAPVGVLAVDIDHFKQVNDTYGHPAGDTVLVAVACALAATARRGDLVARTGGEEFTLLLPGADEATLVARGEQVRAACAALAVVVDTVDTVDVVVDTAMDPALRVRPTVSIGAAIFPHHGAGLAGVLAVADRALYAAKAAGRDRVVLADAVAPAGSAVAQQPHPV